MSEGLPGRVVLVTRPAETADALLRLLRHAGAEVIHLPMQCIEPRRELPRPASLGGPDGPEDDWWIFTSANAARHFVRDEHPLRTPRIAAIGAATAATLEAIGLPPDLVPADAYTSEALLATPEMQAVDGERILIITGEGGRDRLRRELTARGAEVRVLAVYRRVPSTVTPEQLSAALERAQDLIVTNGEALQRLLALCPEAQRERLLSRRLVVPTARVVEMAKSLGFTGPVLAPALMNDAAIVRALSDAPDTGSETRMTQQSDSPAEAVDEPEAQPAGEQTPEAPAPSPAAREEAPSEPPTPAAPVAPRRSGVLVLLWLLIVLLAGALGLGGWLGWKELQRLQADRQQLDERLALTNAELGARDTRITALEQQFDDLLQTARQLDLKLGSLESWQASTAERIGELGDAVQGGRIEMELVSVEQLLLLANERLQLARDPVGAAAALEAADRRLAALSDPRLHPVREAIADERAALRAMPRADIAAAALSLGSLIRRASQLPLAGRTPSRFEPPAAAAEPRTDPAAPWYRRLLTSLRQAFGSMFAVRRETAEIRRLLPPEAQSLTVELLRLKLEGARAALLRNDAVVFIEMLDAADDWLRTQFDAESPAVRAVREEIARLRALELDPPRPDISDSLLRLRAVLEAGRE